MTDVMTQGMRDVNNTGRARPTEPDGMGVQQYDNHPHPKKELRSIEPCSKVDELMHTFTHQL